MRFLPVSYAETAGYVLFKFVSLLHTWTLPKTSVLNSFFNSLDSKWGTQYLFYAQSVTNTGIPFLRQLWFIEKACPLINKFVPYILYTDFSLMPVLNMVTQITFFIFTINM